MSDDWFDETYRSNETTPAALDARVLSAARSAVRRRWFPRAAAVAGGAGGAVRRRPLLAVAGTAIAAATAAFVALPVLDRGGFEPPFPALWDGTDAGRRQTVAPVSSTLDRSGFERPLAVSRDGGGAGRRQRQALAPAPISGDGKNADQGQKVGSAPERQSPMRMKLREMGRPAPAIGEAAGVPPPQAEPELERSLMRLATRETRTFGATSAMQSPEAAIAGTASAGASGLPETLEVLSPSAVPVEAPPPPRVTTAGDDDAPTVMIGGNDRSRGGYPPRPAFRASDVPPEGMLEPESPDIAVTTYGAEVEFRAPLPEMEALTIAITRTEEDGPGEYARGHGAPIGEEEMAGASVPRSGASPGPGPFGRETTADAPARRESVVTLFAASEAACIPNVLRGPLGGPGRADEAHWCPNGRGGLDIDFVWDGGAPCPSRLVVEDAANVRAVLDGNVLVAGRTRYRCIEGRWARIE